MNWPAFFFVIGIAAMLSGIVACAAADFDRRPYTGMLLFGFGALASALSAGLGFVP